MESLREAKSELVTTMLRDPACIDAARLIAPSIDEDASEEMILTIASIIKVVAFKDEMAQLEEKGEVLERLEKPKLELVHG